MNDSMDEAVLYAKKYLEDMLSFFGLNTDVHATNEDEVIQLNVPSTHMNGFLIGQRGDNRLSLLAGAGITGNHQTTARHFDQHLEGAFDHGEVALRWPNHSQHAGVRQVDKVVLYGGHQADTLSNSPLRLLLLLAMIFTW